MSIFGAEVIGTALLILLGNGVVAAVLLAKSKAENGGWIVITWGWGLAVMTGVFAIGQFSGAHLNPAVTIGFWVAGTIDGSDVPHSELLFEPELVVRGSTAQAAADRPAGGRSTASEGRSGASGAAAGWVATA